MRFDVAVLLALVLFASFYFPYSHLLKIGAVMAERFLFAPSLGWVMLVVLLADRGLRLAVQTESSRRTLAVVCVALLCVLGGLQSARRAAEWRDDVKLWQAAQRELPDDHRVLSNLATAHMDRGEIDEARAPLTRALELEPEEPVLRRNWRRFEHLSRESAH